VTRLRNSNAGKVIRGKQTRDDVEAECRCGGGGTGDAETGVVWRGRASEERRNHDGWAEQGRLVNSDKSTLRRKHWQKQQE
jgi:hypothetical protein